MLEFLITYWETLIEKYISIFIRFDLVSCPKKEIYLHIFKSLNNFAKKTVIATTIFKKNVWNIYLKIISC